MARASTPSPIDDLTFDVITVLQNKAKALEAYGKYLEDASDDEELSELFVRIRRQDEEHVRILKDALARRLEEDLGDVDQDEDEDYDDEDDEEVEARGEREGDVWNASSSDSPPRRGESGHRR